MLPAKKKKLTFWRSIKVNHDDMGQKSFTDAAVDPWSLESGSNDFNINSIHKPKSKRIRTFTGQIFMSAAGIPKRLDLKKRVLQISVGLFFAVDLLLLCVFIKSFF